MKRNKTSTLSNDPLWYKDAIVYECSQIVLRQQQRRHRRFPRPDRRSSITSQELGVNAIWLLPFYPSPLRDDGYDIADYRTCIPIYGTLDDVQALHSGGPRARHQGHHRTGHQPHLGPASLVPAARRAPPGSHQRNYYVWSDTDQKYPKTPASSSSIRRRRTGPGIRSPRRITGTASIRISPT